MSEEYRGSTVTENEYERLLEQNFSCLPSLEAPGVGIWEGFDEALDMINGER